MASQLNLALAFRAWKRFRADGGDYHKFLVELAREAKKTFRAGMKGPKSGVTRPGRKQASAAGEYPAVQTGRLMASIQTRVRGNEMTIGTTAPYARYLAEGTTRMGKRKMSEDALEEAISKVRNRIEGAHWTR